MMMPKQKRSIRSKPQKSRHLNLMLLFMQAALYRHQIDVDVACTMLYASVCKKKVPLGTDKCSINLKTMEPNKCIIDYRFSFSSWKKSILKALSKIKVPIFASDIRPTTMLSELSKVLEPVVYMQLSEYVTTNKLLGPKRFCYKKGQNTQTALLGFIKVEDVIKELRWGTNS